MASSFPRSILLFASIAASAGRRAAFNVDSPKRRPARGTQRRIAATLHCQRQLVRSTDWRARSSRRAGRCLE